MSFQTAEEEKTEEKESSQKNTPRSPQQSEPPAPKEPQDKKKFYTERCEKIQQRCEFLLSVMVVQPHSKDEESELLPELSRQKSSGGIAKRAAQVCVFQP